MIVCTNLCKSYPLGHGRKHVLSGVNLTLKPGQRFGLLGRNGAGKTTLIKLIGGVELPDSGKIERHMRISWPLGFGGGFQGSLTGYDNARFIARIYGRNYRDLADFVEDFSELGMRARLAFALSLAIEFDCYLIDEVIMVGDQNFQRKCIYELFEKRQDRALILASHSEYLVREYCDRALVLSGGGGVLFDDVEEAITAYTLL
jgi:capsular polysaccharide transport system ATP-binding protein